MSNSASVIIAHKYGRLGNRLFLGAHFMLNACRHNYVVHFPAFEEYADRYEGSSRSLLSTFPTPVRRSLFRSGYSRKAAFFCLKSLSRISACLGLFGISRIVIGKETPGQVYDLNSEDFVGLIESGRNVFVKGWGFRDGLESGPFRDEIVAYFKPVQSYRIPAEESVKLARSMAPLVVGVHIRQGDYRQWEGGRHFFETSVYVSLMRGYDRLKFGDVAFIVSADEVLRPDDFKGLKVVFAPGNPVSDMHALSLCDMIFGPLSTFSGWASFYGKVPHYFIDGQRELCDESFSIKGLI